MGAIDHAVNVAHESKGVGAGEASPDDRLHVDADAALLQGLRDATHRSDREKEWLFAELRNARDSLGELAVAAIGRPGDGSPTSGRRLLDRLKPGRVLRILRRLADRASPRRISGSDGVASRSDIANSVAPNDRASRVLVTVVWIGAAESTGAAVDWCLSQTLLDWELFVGLDPIGSSGNQPVSDDHRVVLLGGGAEAELFDRAVMQAQGRALHRLVTPHALDPTFLERTLLINEELWSCPDHREGSPRGVLRLLDPRPLTGARVLMPRPLEGAYEGARVVLAPAVTPAGSSHRVVEFSWSDFQVSPGPWAVPATSELVWEVARRLPRLATKSPLHPGDRGPRGDAARRIEEARWSFPESSGRPIVIFVPFIPSGASVLANLVAGFRGEGRTVVVMVTSLVPGGMSDESESIRELTPFVYVLPDLVRSMNWREFMVSKLRCLTDPVILNIGSHWFYPHVSSLRWACGPHVKVIDVLFNNVGHIAGNLPFGAGIDVTVAVYERLASLLEEYGSAGKVVVIPIGIDPPIPRSKVVARRQFGIADEALPVVVWIGRASEEKQPMAFISLAHRLNGAASFAMAGEGPLIDDVRRAAEHVDGLRHLGFVEDSRDLLAAADLLVMTSATEGIPLVAMEAIALGTPVVATRVGGLAELIVPGVNGYLVEAGDPEALEVLVADLLSTPHSLQSLQSSTVANGLAPCFHRDHMFASFSRIAD